MLTDVLSAASLFLALLGMLYSAWYGEVKEASGIVRKLKRADRSPQIEEVCRVLVARVLPLLTGSLLLLVALLDTAWSILSESTTLVLQAVCGGAPVSVAPISLLLFSVSLFSLVLLIDEVRWLLRLRKKLKHLQEPDAHAG